MIELMSELRAWVNPRAIVRLVEERSERGGSFCARLLLLLSSVSGGPLKELISTSGVFMFADTCGDVSVICSSLSFALLPSGVDIFITFVFGPKFIGGLPASLSRYLSSVSIAGVESGFILNFLVNRKDPKPRARKRMSKLTH